MSKQKPQLDLYQKAIARKVGNTFKLACEDGYDIRTFAYKWLCSDVAKQLWSENPTIIAQWALYQLNSFKMEMEEQNVEIPHSDMTTPDEAYWLGYLLTYWGFQEGLMGEQLAEYSIGWMIDQYDTLHTTSIEYAIDAIKEFHEYEEKEK